MKSVKNMVLIGIGISLIVAEIAYAVIFIKRDNRQIAYNQEEIERLNDQINEMEERLRNHEQSKLELSKLVSQKTAIMEMIPDQSSYAEAFNNLISCFRTMVCDKVEIKNGDTNIIRSDMGAITKREYTISFYSTYAESKKFIENLNSMYQAANISHYSFDTGIQNLNEEEEERYRALFKDEIWEIGKTEFNFSIFYHDTSTIRDEIYHPYFTGKINENPFKNKIPLILGTDTQGGSSNQGQSNSLDTKPDIIPELPSTNSSFKISISDILTSGDTYKVSGPGKEVGSYVGMVSDSDVTFDITINKDYYELKITDAVGQIKKSKVELPCNNPTIRITSSMRAVQTIMPNIRIKIHNNINKEIFISKEGTMLDNIHIFDSKGQEVTEGKSYSKLNIV